MGTIPVWIKRTQTAGLIVTGAAIGYYYVSPALRVEEVSLPANTLLAKARMFGTDGKKQVMHTRLVPSSHLWRSVAADANAYIERRRPSMTHSHIKTASK